MARASGFAGWPSLARHIETLRGLEGTWCIERMEVEGAELPAPIFADTRLLIDGDRFRTETPEADHEGIFNLDIEGEPAAIDIEFVAGPEAGNRNHGIFRLDGDTLEICLDVNGKARPQGFRTAKGSGQVWERFHRVSPARPAAVDGGQRGAPAAVPAGLMAGDFAFRDTPLLRRLQGEWSAVEVVRDGQQLPAAMLQAGRRVAIKGEVKISFGGRIATHALASYAEATDPVEVDYQNIGGINAGKSQLGIFRWEGDNACFCIAAPGDPRPKDFTSLPGSGRTLSRWKKGL